DLGRLDPGAIERVRAEVGPDPRDAEELHDLLMTVFGLRPVQAWESWFEELVGERRAVRAQAAPATVLWCAVERRQALEALFPAAEVVPDHPSPIAVAADPDTAAAEMLRGHLESRGPSTVADLAAATGLPAGDVAIAVARLEGEGFAFRGHFTAPDGPEEFCARRLLARIHSYTRARQRREIEPVTARDLMRFLLRWQHLAPGTHLEGRAGALSVVEQLQGFELAAAAWERPVLASRVEGYRVEWLDDLCLSGDVTWGRLSIRNGGSDEEEAPRRRGVSPTRLRRSGDLEGGVPPQGRISPSRATPITLAVREDLPWLLQAARGERTPPEPGPGPCRDVLEALRRQGALFPADLAASTGRSPQEVEEALWEAVARGLVLADGFEAVRSLLYRRAAARVLHRPRLRRAGSRRPGRFAGRWSPAPAAAADADPD
ncbi:MAG: ATP-dependent DNA helicase, partial [Candidatus Dormibacteraeota bacterium]|nr:ATP-dependent DNA helicase [Candidatus Dormibacteraeota bacterium]